MSLLLFVLLNRYYRKWLHFPVSGNITHLSLLKSKLGLNIKTLKQIYVECKVSVRQTLKLSRSEELELYISLQTIKNVNTNCLINSIGIAEKHLFRNKTKSVLSKATKETSWNEFLDLKEQGGIIKFLVNTIPSNLVPVSSSETAVSLFIKCLKCVPFCSTSRKFNNRKL